MLYWLSYRIITHYTTHVIVGVWQYWSNIIHFQNYYLPSPIVVSCPVTVMLCWRCWSGSRLPVAPSWLQGQIGSVEEPQFESLCHLAALWFLPVPFCVLVIIALKSKMYLSTFHVVKFYTLSDNSKINHRR